MRRFLPFLLFLALLCPLGASAVFTPPNGTVGVQVYDYSRSTYGSTEHLAKVKVELDGGLLNGSEVPAVVVKGRTMAPLRWVAERLGAKVTWVQGAAQVVVTRGSDTMTLTMGKSTAQVNGVERRLPDGVPAMAMFYGGQGHTMVPIRFFSEMLGCTVTWEQKSYTARVSSTGLDTPVSPERFLIALDAGHGGTASGAYYEKTAEKDLNLAMTRKLDEILRGLGYRTMLTRSTDVDVGLKRRSALANEAKADIFVSIHCNASETNRNFRGLYVYHYPGSVQGAALAQAIQTPACQFTGAIDRGTNSANFSVVRESKMPAVLVETGFMTNHEELLRLKDEVYQTRMAQGIAQGIIRYLNGR